MRILCVVGARPNLVKIAPVMRALEAADGLEPLLCHTQQHYDDGLSGVFFRELGIRDPDIALGVGSGTHAVQTAAVMVEFEKACLEAKPDVVLAPGDVNSTVAAALVAVKLGIPVAHVEAGLRSGDKTMPEEWNRILTDQMADWCFTTSRDADAHLRREGIEPDRIHFVGNVMIDTLLRHKDEAIARGAAAGMGLEPGNYAVVTLHRPANVDDERVFGELCGVLAETSAELPLVFPVHPRSRKMLAKFGLDETLGDRVRMIDPLGYLDFIGLQAQARLVLTDSGGIQEESTALGVPCLTLRDNTERPVTAEVGTNRVIGRDPQRLRTEIRRALDGDVPAGSQPELWDGRAAERIAAVLASYSA